MPGPLAKTPPKALESSNQCLRKRATRRGHASRRSRCLLRQWNGLQRFARVSKSPSSHKWLHEAVGGREGSAERWGLPHAAQPPNTRAAAVTWSNSTSLQFRQQSPGAVPPPQTHPQNQSITSHDAPAAPPLHAPIQRLYPRSFSWPVWLVVFAQFVGNPACLGQADGKYRGRMHMKRAPGRGCVSVLVCSRERDACECMSACVRARASVCAC